MTILLTVVYKNTCQAFILLFHRQLAQSKMSKVLATRSQNLEAFFEKMRRQAMKNSQTKQKEVKQPEQQSKSKDQEQPQSTFYANNKQNTRSQDKKSTGSTTKSKRKITLLDYFQSSTVGFNTKERSRTRDRVKKSKKKTNSKKLDKNQTTLHKFYPNVVIKVAKPEIKKEFKKQKQLTLQFFCKEKSQKIDKQPQST